MIDLQNQLYCPAKYSCHAVTVTMTGDYPVIYQRFLQRNESPDRHRGHVVNDHYPEGDQAAPVKPIPYESFVAGIVNRGMDNFSANGPRFVLDTTNFGRVDKEALFRKIMDWREGLAHD